MYAQYRRLTSYLANGVLLRNRRTHMTALMTTSVAAAEPFIALVHGRLAFSNVLTRNLRVLSKILIHDCNGRVEHT